MTDAEQQAEPLDVRNIEPTIGSCLQAFFDRSKLRVDPSRFEDEPTDEQKSYFARGGR